MISITIANAGTFSRIGTPAMRGAVCEQGVHRGIGAEERRAVAVRQVVGQLDAEAASSSELK